MEKLHADFETLASFHRFGDILEEAINAAQSDKVTMEPVRSAHDCIGRHWYGERCQVRDKRNGAGYYLHIGLIYFRTTRYGIMVELDEQNNASCYATVKKNIAESPLYDINRDEPTYFKLFVPNETFDALSGMKRGEQVKVLSDFVKAAAEGIADAAYEEGFRITFRDMDDARNLAEAFDAALTGTESDLSRVEVNYKDKDNFGQYAEGFRYWLSDPDEKVRMYAYFGAIYSYKKMPAGIFAEIDWFSNQGVFDGAFANMKEDAGYLMSIREPKFIKLFMTAETLERFNGAEPEEQMEILKAFLKNCNDHLVTAALAGVNGGEKNE